MYKRQILDHISDIDIDIAEGNLLQALFLISWISDKLEWAFSKIEKYGELIKIEFKRNNGEMISTSINSLPLGNPSIHL